MKVVNPIGRKADDATQVNASACRCSLNALYAAAASSGMGCACRDTSVTGGQIYHNVKSAH